MGQVGSPALGRTREINSVYSFSPNSSLVYVSTLSDALRRRGNGICVLGTVALPASKQAEVLRLCGVSMRGVKAFLPVMSLWSKFPFWWLACTVL